MRPSSFFGQITHYNETIIFSGQVTRNNFPPSFMFTVAQYLQEKFCQVFKLVPQLFLFFSFPLFFFVNFDFSYFFVFLKTSNIKINSTRKISDHKIYALKIERVPNSFENFNSFEMTLKMLKTMQIYQKCIFQGFHCFFAIFWFFL